MAIYHCSIKVIGRNTGRSSVAAAAYRAGERLVNEYDGLEHDFTKKNWVEYTEIILPENAPSEYFDRSTLWNAVEQSEKSKDAQLCREFELALPVEMTREQQIEVVRQFAIDVLVAQGMAVDIAIHSPPLCNDRHQPIDAEGKPTKDKDEMQFQNPHAHILATMRPLDEKGKWVAKTQKEYLCKRGDEEKGFTSEEFIIEKDNGWQKQYRYMDGKKKVWLTPDVAKEQGLEKIDRNPKATPYGRKNPVIEHWNSKDTIYEWRQAWAKIINDKFESLNSDTRVDCRSFIEQGREELPTIHMGTSATNMERRAARELLEGKNEKEVVRSDIGDINRHIKEHNRFIAVFKEKIAQIGDAVKKQVEKISLKLQDLRTRILGKKYEAEILRPELEQAEIKMTILADRIGKYESTMSGVTAANARAQDKINTLEKELKECGVLQFDKKKQLTAEIERLIKSIEENNEYAQSIGRMCKYTGCESVETDKQELSSLKKEQSMLEARESAAEEELKRLEQEYKLILANVPLEMRKEVEKLCPEAGISEKALSILRKEHGNSFNVETFDKVKVQIKQELDVAKNNEYVRDTHKSVRR